MVAYDVYKKTHDKLIDNHLKKLQNIDFVLYPRREEKQA